MKLEQAFIHKRMVRGRDRSLDVTGLQIEPLKPMRYPCYIEAIPMTLAFWTEAGERGKSHKLKVFQVEPSKENQLLVHEMELAIQKDAEFAVREVMFGNIAFDHPGDFTFAIVVNEQLLGSIPFHLR